MGHESRAGMPGGSGVSARIQNQDRFSEALVPTLPLLSRIENLFGKELVTAGAEFVPAVLEMHDLECVNQGVHEVSAGLAELGYHVEVEYFAKVESKEAPIATLVARSPKGDYAFPNFNLRLNPEIPRERGVSGDPRKRYTLVSAESDAISDDTYLPSPAAERFPSTAEVRILVERSDDPDVPYRLVPLYSNAAFDIARRNAAAASRDALSGYSYIFHELALPALGAELHRRSEYFGEHEIPRTLDLGSQVEGERLSMRGWASGSDASTALDADIFIRCENLRAEIRLVPRS